MSKWTMAFVGVSLVILVLLQIRSGNEFSWQPSYELSSTDPLGSKAFADWLRRVAPVTEPAVDKRFSEWLPSADTSNAVVVITDRLDPDPGSLEALCDFMERGGSVVIATRELSDTLETIFDIWITTSYNMNEIRDVRDTNRFFPDVTMPTTKPVFPDHLFSWKGDSLGDYDDPAVYGPWEPHVIGRYDRMISGRRPFGKGELTLTINPALFTNYAMLYEDLWWYTEALVEQWPNKPLTLDQHYKPSKGNRQGIMYSVTQNPSLSFAYYTTLIVSMVFVILGVRRKQRAIPTVDPPINTSIEFAKTVAQLYSVSDTRTAIAVRMADQFARLVRRRTGLRLGVDAVRAEVVAQSLGVPLADITEILTVCEALRNVSWEASAEAFRQFHQRLQPIIDKGIV